MALLLRKVAQLEEEVKDLKQEVKRLKSRTDNQHEVEINGGVDSWMLDDSHEDVLEEIRDRILRMNNFMIQVQCS